MSLLLGATRHRLGHNVTSSALGRCSTSFTPLSSINRIERRTLFGVGAPLTIASISACKTLLWGTIGLNGAVFAAWFWSSRKDSQRGRGGGGWMQSMNTKPTAEQRLNKVMRDNFLVRPSDIKNGKIWTLLTSAFSHTEPYHILGNMFTLHAFSSVLIYSGVPPLALGTLMLGSALAGSLGFITHERNRLQNVPPGFQMEHAALGASGMVMGLGAAAAMLAPNANMLLFGVIPAPMWALFAGYTLYDTYYIDNPMSRTGHAAHLGGGAFGVLFYVLVLRRLGGVF